MPQNRTQLRVDDFFDAGAVSQSRGKRRYYDLKQQHRRPPPSPQHDRMQMRISRSGGIEPPMIGVVGGAGVSRGRPVGGGGGGSARPTGLGAVSDSAMLRAASVTDLLEAPVAVHLRATGTSPVAHGVLVIEFKARLHCILPRQGAAASARQPQPVRFVASDVAADTSQAVAARGLLCEYWEVDEAFPERALGAHTVAATAASDELLRGLQDCGGNDDEPAAAVAAAAVAGGGSRGAADTFRFIGMLRLRRALARDASERADWEAAVAGMAAAAVAAGGRLSVAGVAVARVAVGGGRGGERADANVDGSVPDVNDQAALTEDWDWAAGGGAWPAQASMGKGGSGWLAGNVVQSRDDGEEEAVVMPVAGDVEVSRDLVFQCFKPPERVYRPSWPTASEEDS
ncbi:hypothetical protein HK405_012780 [Cladochytrium tenue]|nr:hypothetical protein HK405_012780 [Cladochytrium tenue]